MRRIQIEGDEREFLMDPQGQIFDMNGQFIGTANTNELEELQDDANGQNNSQTQNENNGMTDGWNNQGQNQHEEMMLDSDEDDIIDNKFFDQNQYGNKMNQQNYGKDDGRRNLMQGNNNSLDGGTMDMDTEQMPPQNY